MLADFCRFLSVFGQSWAQERAQRPRLEKRYINQRKLAPGVAQTPNIVILQSSNNVGSPPPPPPSYAREKVKNRVLRGRSDFDVLKNRQNLKKNGKKTVDIGKIRLRRA